MKSIYLDAASTTPPSHEVISSIQKVQSEYWGNPSSLHEQGLVAAEILERSSAEIASSLGVKEQEIF